ncbi:hypothetical protein QBC45DRAFT_417525 [Copromyces sp. CBS 386.78]|nr:hypothetical protein QBC45DRAFT_417525 [Copromyces sp. CBS 386.78]
MTIATGNSQWNCRQNLHSYTDQQAALSFPIRTPPPQHNLALSSSPLSTITTSVCSATVANTMAGPYQGKDVEMSNTFSFSQGTTSLAIRNRAAPQDMVALDRLVRDIADGAERATNLGLAQLTLHDTNAAKVANAAAIFKMQEHVAVVGHRGEKHEIKVHGNVQDLQSQLRMERRRTDRLEKLVEILLEERTMPATEENRALFTKKIDKVERQYKATCAKQDVAEVERRRVTRGPYSSD